MQCILLSEEEKIGDIRVASMCASFSGDKQQVQGDLNLYSRRHMESCILMTQRSAQVVKNQCRCPISVYLCGNNVFSAISEVVLYDRLHGYRDRQEVAKVGLHRDLQTGHSRGQK